MDDKKLNYIAALERAVEEEYGQKATINPKSLWDKSKEEEYLEQLKEFAIVDNTTKQNNEKVEINGILVPKKLLSSDTSKVCANCNKYSFDRQDDLYLNKFRTCYDCYVLVVEDREDKWFNGDKYNGK
jgi:hypothetical protein